MVDDLTGDGKDKRCRVELSPFESDDAGGSENNIDGTGSSNCCYLCNYCSKLFIA